MAKSKPTTGLVTKPQERDAPAYTVVARRYRPQQFSELIGQEHVANALVNALQSGRVAHAYLFTGARGVGKTSAARILAKALNCVTGPTATPCDVCDSCKAIATGEDVDVLEIDGASNNRVDEARDLRQNVGFRPTRGRYKVYIIDEVHMLSTGAFNALLKTMEEPPEHVKFILATTEVQKIPITILSRCQRFDFAHVGPGKIFDQLKRIVDHEGLEADEAALRIVARRAAGSMRDSQSLLDQLLSSATGKLTAEHVNAVLGTAGDDRVIELVNAILAPNPAIALELIDSWVEHGLQVGELLDQFIEYWRALMLVNCGGNIRELPVSPNQAEAVQSQAQSLSLDAILAGLELLTATKLRMRGSSHTQVLLEMAVIRLCRLSDLLPVSQLVQTLTQSGAQNVTIARTSSKPTAQVATSGENVKKNLELSEKTGSTEVIPSESATIALSEKTLHEVWNRFLQYVVEKLPFLAKHLKHASSYANLGPNSLVIRFPSSYNESQTQCSGETGQLRLQDALRRITGQTIALRFERDTSAKAAEPVATAMVSQPDKKRSLATLPLFKKASEVLGAQIWHVDEDFNPDALPKAANSVSEQPTDSDEE